jgi:hypothetical protein
VADVLGVATLEVGDPVAVFVLMEGDDFARKVHGRRIAHRRTTIDGSKNKGKI